MKQVIIECNAKKEDFLAIRKFINLNAAHVRGIIFNTNKKVIDDYFLNLVKESFDSSEIFVIIATDSTLLGNSNFESKILYKNFYEKLEYSWDIYNFFIEEDHLYVITLGKLTNLSKALIKYPILEDKISSLLMMAGTRTVGDITAVAEKNIYSDTYACEYILNTRILEISLILLDTLYKSFKNNFENLKEKYSELDNDIDIFDFFKKNAIFKVFCDPKVVNYVRRNCRVELFENNEYGRLVIDERYHSEYKKNINISKELVLV